VVVVENEWKADLLEKARLAANYKQTDPIVTEMLEALEEAQVFRTLALRLQELKDIRLAAYGEQVKVQANTILKLEEGMKELRNATHEVISMFKR
jgi:hypothetical protein